MLYLRASCSPRSAWLGRHVGTLILAAAVALAEPFITPGQIDSYLSTKGSPLAGLGQLFVDGGCQHDVDPRLLIAIAGAESGFGTTGVCSQHKNPFSWFWCLKEQTCSEDDPAEVQCAQSFYTTWGRSVEQVAKWFTLRYLDEDLRLTIPRIGQKYCKRNCQHWVRNVTQFYQQLGGDVGAIGFRCTGTCGNGHADVTEDCDGTDDAVCPGRCNPNCVCSTCGNNVIEVGEECDGTAPQAECATQGCRPNCTINCGTCMACLSDACTDITPSVTEPRWAVVIQHAGGHGCTCSPPGNCTCGWGVALDMGYYPIFPDSHPRPIGCCYKGSSGSSAQHFPSCGNLPPECDEKYQLNLTWGEYQACKPMNCVQPGVGCIPPEEFDRFDEAPPLGTVFDLRIKAEKDSGCGVSPENVPALCAAPSCCS